MPYRLELGEYNIIHANFHLRGGNRIKFFISSSTVKPAGYLVVVGVGITTRLQLIWFFGDHAGSIGVWTGTQMKITCFWRRTMKCHILCLH